MCFVALGKYVQESWLLPTERALAVTSMNGLSCGEESMKIYSTVLIGCQRVTDGQTDVQPISITCFSIPFSSNSSLKSKNIRHFITFFAHFCLPCVRLWDNHGKCHTVGKRIQCNTFTAIHLPRLSEGPYTGEAKM